MKYCISIALIAIMFSCKKNKDNNTPAPLPPSIKGIEISSRLVDTLNHPQITFTLDVPDTSYVRGLYVYQAASFPYFPAGGLSHLSSGKFSVIDLAVIYPPAKPIKYISVFGLNDGTFILNDTFVVK